MMKELDCEALKTADKIMWANCLGYQGAVNLSGAIQAYLDAADLVERSELKLLLNKPDRKVLQLAEERDEACAQIAALRKALEWIEPYLRREHREIIRAALTDTAEAAAQAGEGTE